MKEVLYQHQQPEDECTFCDILGGPATSAFDVLEPLEGTGVSLKPALGMLMPGYFLTVTHEHMTSLANMTRDKLAGIDAALTEVEHELEPVFGRYFRLEHGSDNITHCGSGGCIDHAHQHLMPADDDVGEYIFRQFDWQRLRRFGDLADFKGKPYMYLGRLGVHYAVSEPELPGQWGRRQVGAVRGIDHWDWALYAGDTELALTLKGLERVSGFQTLKSSPLMKAHHSQHTPASETQFVF